MTSTKNPRYKLHDHLFHGAEAVGGYHHWEGAQALGDRLWAAGYRRLVSLSETSLSDYSFDRLDELQAGSVVLAGGVAFTCTEATGHIRWAGFNTFMTAEELIDLGNVTILHDAAWESASNV